MDFQWPHKPRIMTHCKHGGGSSRQRSWIRRPLLAVAGACEITFSFSKRIPGGCVSPLFKKFWHILGHSESIRRHSFFWSNLASFWNPKIRPDSPKKLRKPSRKPSQNGSQIASYVPTPEMFKNGTTMVRKPHFGSLLAFRNRFKIDAKTSKISFILDTLLDP